MTTTIAPANASASKAIKTQEGNSWRLWRNKDGVAIYQRRSILDNDVIEIKAKLSIQTSLNTLLLFLEDDSNIPKWLDNAQHAKVKPVSANQNQLTVYFNSIWPVQQRAMRVHSTINRDISGAITIEVKDSNANDWLSAEYIKISVLAGQWRIEETAENTLSIQYLFAANPNGQLPNWLVKQLTLSSAWKTLTNIKKQLPLAQFPNKTHPFIKEKQ